MVEELSFGRGSSYLVEQEMPSGRRVLLRPVSWSLLLRRGRIPDVLLPIVNDLLDGKSGTIPTTSIEEKRAFYQLLDDLTVVGYAFPKVVEGETLSRDGEVHIDDIEEGDKLYLWTMIGAGAEQMRSFRYEQVFTLVDALARELQPSASFSDNGGTTAADG